MSYDYSDNILVQESAGHLLNDELGWEVAFAYNTERVGKTAPLAAKATRIFCWLGIFGKLCCA